MSSRIGATPVRYPFSFVIAGDSGAWPDPTADAIFAQLLRQAAEPRPAFFVQLGDFAGPGSVERHEHYLELVSALPVPNVCLIGNHDLEDPRAGEAWSAVHGPRNFQFAYGSTRFVAIDGASGQAGPLGDTTPPDTAGPGAPALRHPDEALAAAPRPHRRGAPHPPPHPGAAPRRAPARAAAPRRPLRAAARVRLPPGRGRVPRDHPPARRQARL